MFKKIPRTLINLRLIIRIVGWLLIIEAGFLVFPTITCLIYSESDWLPFGATSAGTLLVGLLLAWQSHPVSMYAGKRDGYLLTSLVWVVFSFFGLIPFLFCSHRYRLPMHSSSDVGLYHNGRFCYRIGV